MAPRGALFVAVLAVGLAGYHALQRLDRRLEPQVPSPYGAVEVRLPGVSAAELERVLSVPLERELLRLPAVLDSWAETRDGLVLISLECQSDAAESGSAWASIEDLLDRQSDALGEDFIGLSGPVLHRPSEQYAEALVTVIASDDEPGPPVASALRLADALSALPGVAHVELFGRPREQIVLTYEDDDLATAGLNPMAFREYLRAQHVLAPGAYLTSDGLIQPLETVSRIRDFAELTHLPVRDPADGDPVSMSRLLDVKREPVHPTVDRLSADGRPAVALAVHRVEGADLSGFAEDVRASVAAHGAREGVTAEPVVFQPDVVQEEFDRFSTNLLQGFVVILVLLVLNLGPRVGLSVAGVLPFVILASFLVMHAAGLGLDIVSLSSFILVLGLLVDNHIVMAERIRRLAEQGVGRGEAMTRAVRELAGPLTAAAATTALGFLPVVLTDDPIGHYVSALFWVVLITLSISLLFCFFVTPRLAPVNAPTRTGDTAMERRYKALLAWCFARPWLHVVVVLVLCVAGWQLLGARDQIFFPVSARPLWVLEVERPQGVEVEGTEQVTDDLERLLATERGRDGTPLRQAVTFVGRSAPPLQASIPYREYAPHTAQVLLQLDPDRDPAPFEARMREWMGTQAHLARLRLRPVELGEPLLWPVQIEVRGPQQGMAEVAQAVAQRLEAAGCINISSDWSEPITKLSVEPDRAALAERDLTVGDVTLGMHSVVHGLPLFELLEDDVRTPVMLRAAVRRESPREALADAYVYPRKGDPSLLYEVADVREVQDHPVRARRRGAPAMTVRAETPDPDRALTVERLVDAELDDLRAAHPAWSLTAQGVSASSERANRAMLEQVPWALLAILLCLLAQSRSLIETGLILLTVPLSLAGVAFGLAVLDEPFSFMTLVGMTALAGIVVNNAIVLLASVRRRVEDAGTWSRELVIDSASHRLRPILLTTLCALASMAVLRISGGSMWQPLATAVISGLVVSTSLVLFVLPVLYGVALGWANGAREG
jgi:multidrug efflux pump subunit AcrB